MTVTSAVPLTPGGETTEIDWSDWTSNSLAGVWPKSTPVAPVKVDPEIVRSVPPAAGPFFADSFFTTGTTPVCK